MIGLGIGNGLGVGVTGSPASALPGVLTRGPASNANVYPYGFNGATTNNYQTSQKRFRVPDNADYSQIKMRIPNFISKFNGTPYETNGPAQTFFCSLVYDGVIYPGTFSSAATIDSPGGDVSVTDVFAGLTLRGGSFGEMRVGVIGPAGSTAYPTSQVLNGLWSEWLYQSAADTTNYVTGNIGMGATATCTVAGGNITALSRTNAGSGYTASAEVWAYELQSDGTYAQKKIGTVTQSGGGITNSFTITSGTPPSGATWTNPTIRICYGNTGFTSTLASRGFTGIITGIPSVPVRYCFLGGSSLVRGNGTGLAADINQNQGFVEVGIANRCGILNCAIGSGQHRYLGDPTKYPLLYAEIAASGCTHAIIDPPTNDIDFNNYSKVTAEGFLTTFATNLRSVTYGSMQVNFTTMTPRTTSSDSWATVDGQTPITSSTADAFTAGGMADLITADIRSGTVVSNNNYIDPKSLLDTLTSGGAGAPLQPAWLAGYTPDGVHENLTALGALNNSSAYKAQFNFLGVIGGSGKAYSNGFSNGFS